MARVHYDESGRSLGTAEVVFERRVDAIAAQKKYNTLNLDGNTWPINPFTTKMISFRSPNGH